MLKANSKTIFLLIIFGLYMLYSPAQVCYAKDKDSDEKQFTEAQIISPQTLDNAQNRSYDEGVTVNDVEITGNNLVKSEDILKNISMKKGAIFDKDQVQKDLKSIYDMGYFTEKLKAVPQTSPSGVKLKIQVEENAPVTGFTISGNKIVDTEEIAKILNSQTGLPQNIAGLNKAVEKIEDLYAQKGYVLARVKRISDDPDGVINIEINEGIIDKVKITGNTKTKDFVIKRNIVTASGNVYNENVLKQDLSRIFATQSFSDVRRVISASPDNPDKYVVSIEVDEKRTGSISLGGGVDTVTGLFGSVGYNDNNFRGRGQQLSTSFTAGSGVLVRDQDTIRRASLQFETNFVEPRLFQTLNSLQTSAYFKELASYEVPLALEKRIGGEIEIGRPIKKVPHLAGSISTGVETVKMEEGDYTRIQSLFAQRGIDIGKRAEQLHGGTYISMGPSLVFDTRNSIVNPTSGWYTTGGFKESFMLSGQAGTFGKANLSVRRFYPVGQKSTFTIDGKIGSKVLGNIPDFAAFRLGGSNTIRGFKEGYVGDGTGYMMSSAEFRTPIPFVEKVTKINFFRDIRAVFFCDAGTVFRTNLTNTLYNRPGYGVAIGTGLNFIIPGLGPIRVNYGYPLTYVGTGNPKGAFNFDFGENN